jgi:4-amino-4-deoxy-L-arabinose transferase-like glycosyltransferase
MQQTPYFSSLSRLSSLAWSKHPYFVLFALVLVLLTTIRLAVIGHFELAPDEAYYWTWSRQLDWSYYDQGPLLGLVIRLASLFFPTASEFSVRFASVIFSLLSSCLLFFMAKEITGSAKIAFWSFLFMNITLLFAAGAVLMMHDSVMMFFWLLALWMFYRALYINWEPGWILGAFALGLGALAKYTMALFVPCLLLVLVTEKSFYPFWRKPHLYLAGGITLVLTLPIVLWNFKHNWASFGHVNDLSGKVDTWHFTYKFFGDYLLGQLALFSPILAGMGVAALIWAWPFGPMEKTSPPDPKNFLFLFSLPIFLFFGFLSLKSSVYANWPASAYPALFILLAWWAVNGLKSRLGKRLFALGVVLSLATSILAHVEALTGFLPASGRAEVSLNRIRGWRELGQKAQVYWNTIPDFKSEGFITTTRYQTASILAFYMPSRPFPHLLSRNNPPKNQYFLWNDETARLGKNALIVAEESWEIDFCSQFFKQTTVLEPFAVTRRGKQVRKVYFAVGRGYLGRKIQND